MKERHLGSLLEGSDNAFLSKLFLDFSYTFWKHPGNLRLGHYSLYLLIKSKKFSVAIFFPTLSKHFNIDHGS